MIKNRLFIITILACCCVALSCSKPVLAADMQAMEQEANQLLERVEESVKGKIERLEEEAQKEGIEAGQEEIGVPASLSAEEISKKHKLWSRKVELWSKGDLYEIEQITPEQLSEALSEATAIAAYNGLDTEKLNKLYEFGKKLVRQSGFELPDRIAPDKDETISGGLKSYFKALFLYAGNREVEIAEFYAEKQRYRVVLFKRVILAYLRALLSSNEKIKDCAIKEGNLSYNEAAGKKIPTYECYDPVVENLRDYVNAVREISNAEDDVFFSHAQIVVAEQQLAADGMSILPGAGEAMDVYAMIAGEDISGQCLSYLDYSITALSLVLPYITPTMLEQYLKRSPKARENLVKVQEFMEAAGGYWDWMIGNKTRYQAMDMMDDLAKRWELDDSSSLKKFHDYIKEALAYTPDANSGLKKIKITDSLQGEKVMGETIFSAAAGKNALEILQKEKPELFERALKESKDALDKNLLSLPGQNDKRNVLKNSGMVEEHVEVIGEYVDELAEAGDKTILIYRDVNPDATELIRKHYGTKDMTIKGKSADWGAHRGFIPVDQKFSKIGNPNKKANAQQLADIEEFSGKVKKFLKKKKGDVDKFKVPLVIDDMDVLIVKKKGADAKEFTAFFDRNSGKYLDEARNPIDANTLDLADKRPLEVLAAPHPETGEPIALTADYDLMAFGFDETPNMNAPELPSYDDDTGYISERQEQIVKEINERVRDRAGYKGGNVSHHGPEVQFPFSPGALSNDPKITVIDPELGVISIPRCDKKCMEKWCSTTGKCPANIKICEPDSPMLPCLPADPDRLLKDYFHNRRHNGYNLFPNAAWNWGLYNPVGGWTVQGYMSAPIGSDQFHYYFSRGVSAVGKKVDDFKKSAVQNLMSGLELVLECPRGKGSGDLE